MQSFAPPLQSAFSWKALGISVLRRYHRSVLNRALNRTGQDAIANGPPGWVRVRTIQRRLWFTAVTCAAIAIAIVCRFHPSKSRSDDKTISTAEDEVYEAVVRDMVTPPHGQPSTSQLVFDDTVLTDLTTEADTTEASKQNSCKERVRKRLPLQSNTPEFDSLADKIYRVLTRGYGYDDGLLRPDTVQDFIVKSCSEGHLSRTFHTDLARTFVDRDSVAFESVLSQKSASKDFRQTFAGASGMISMSRVGFDSSLHEAIVSTEFTCGLLCGESRRYVLRKTRGRWVVVQNLVVGIS